MKRIIRCQKPSCGQKFGLVRSYKYSLLGNTQYCSDTCKKLHCAEINAEAVKERRWFAFLAK